MSLTLEIEFLTGVCRAAHGSGVDAPDWPPQPDRVFSALVSAWGTRGGCPRERTALEWLENQREPEIRASSYACRTTPTVYVPPNDFQTTSSELNKLKWYREFLACGKRPPEKGGYKKEWEKALSTLPDNRLRKDRQFPAARPDDPNMALIWQNEPDTKTINALNAIASCVGYVGHSASLTRCRFFAGDVVKPRVEPMSARRWVYPGRLRELERAHQANPERPDIRPGAPVLQESAKASESQTEWLVLEAIKGDVPDIRASALVCRRLRQALMAGYGRSGQGKFIPEVVSGHRSDGTPTRNPHLAVAPMAFVGSPHADGRVFGFALIPPQDFSLPEIDGFRDAFEAVAAYDSNQQRRVLKLQGSPLRGPLELAPAPDNADAKKSLLPDPYLNKSYRWASVTPIVLEWHLKKGDDAEIRELVARACENAGLPRPQPNRIRVGKHSALNGAPPARPLAGEPPWTRWKLPRSLASRQLAHAVIEFDQPVSGPVLLGAGRFTGLGLCRRVGD